jgi:hypothetical protein
MRMGRQSTETIPYMSQAPGDSLYLRGDTAGSNRSRPVHPARPLPTWEIWIHRQSSSVSASSSKRRIGGSERVVLAT